MSSKDLAQYHGKLAWLFVEGGELSIRVEVKDSKFSFGNARLLITPVEGQGEKWVNKDRLTGLDN